MRPSSVLRLLLGAIAVCPLLADTVVSPSPAPVAATAVRSDLPAGVAPKWLATPPERALAAEALRRVSAWYADGGVPHRRPLHVVYFSPTDRPPFPGHRGRLDRILRQVRDYYAAEMVANGLPPLSFRLEFDDSGLVRVHHAVGDKPLAGYTKSTAIRPTREGAERVLREAGVDPATAHVLVVCQMTDGISPYYGDGSGDTSRSFCWVCDLAGLDSENLASPLDKAATQALAKPYTEAQVAQYRTATGAEPAAALVAGWENENREAFRGRPLGFHTAVYVGGIAHELGHCFNLPHTGENPDQQATHGVSLMGQGTFTYGEELRQSGAKGTFLVPTDAVSLLSHPLFIGMDKALNESGEARFAALHAKPEARGLRVTGRVAEARVPVYAVVLTLNLGSKGGDYHSNANYALVDPATGEFSVTLERDSTGDVDIMLTALHMNGKRTELHTPSRARGFVINTAMLNRSWAFMEARRLHALGRASESAAAAGAAAEQNPDGPGIRAIADAWARAYATPGSRVAPGNLPTSLKTVSLADCAAERASTGYGPAPVSHDRVPSAEFGPVGDIGGEPGPRVLFSHAPGEFVFDLAGGWKSLTGAYGVQRGMSGGVGLEIIADGRKLFAGGRVDAGANSPFVVDVTGVHQLTLRITDGGDGNTGDWGVIANPTLVR